MLKDLLKSVRDWADARFLKLAGGTLTGALGGTTAAFSGKVEAGTYLQAKDNIVVGPSTTSASTAFDSTNPKIEFQNMDATQNGQLLFTDYDAIHTGATLAWITDQSQSWFHTQHIQATGSITSDGTVTAGQSENIKSTAVNDASVATSSNTAITNRLDYSGNGTQVGYSQIMRTSSGMYRSFAVTNPKASKTTCIYLDVYDDGAQSVSFTSGVALAAANGGTGRAMTTANRTYWCGRILYDNNTGTNGTVTLAETAANFAFMFIGIRSDSSQYTGLFVRSPNGKTVTLACVEAASGYNYVKTRKVSISGKSISGTTSTHTGLSGSAAATSSANEVYITHVIGFS